MDRFAHGIIAGRFNRRAVRAAERDTQVACGDRQRYVLLKLAEVKGAQHVIPLDAPNALTDISILWLAAKDPT